MNSVVIFKQKTAYEMRISDWSSDVCSSDLRRRSAEARHVRVLSRLRRADAARDPVQRHLLAEAEGPSPVLRLRHAGRPQWPGHELQVPRSGDAVAQAPDLHPGLERGGRWRAQIGRANVCTPVTNAHPVCRLLLE